MLPGADIISLACMQSECFPFTRYATESRDLVDYYAIELADGEDEPFTAPMDGTPC